MAPCTRQGFDRDMVVLTGVVGRHHVNVPLRS
jgi:hypothetical protein